MSAGREFHRKCDISYRYLFNFTSIRARRKIHQHVRLRERKPFANPSANHFDNDKIVYLIIFALAPANTKHLYHIYNVGPTSKTLGRRYIIVIQMFCVLLGSSRYCLSAKFVSNRDNVRVGPTEIPFNSCSNRSQNVNWFFGSFIYQMTGRSKRFAIAQICVYNCQLCFLS